MPRLPADWKGMSFRNVHAFETVFDLVVTRTEGGLRIETQRNGGSDLVKIVKAGEPVQFTF